ncbi:MAG TPA: hypothetical protein VN580_04705, partial [Clostridia bacterium]|nr:hypothetical protein [Clostridia bacterium]
DIMKETEGADENMQEAVPEEKKKIKKKEKTGKNEKANEAAGEGFLSNLEKRKRAGSKEAFSVKLWEDLDGIIRQVQDITGEKQNSIVNHILREAYNEENKTFKPDIPAEKKQKDKATSFLLEEKHLKAVKKTADKLNMSAAAYFNKLLLTYAQEYILPDIERKKAEQDEEQ